ncbi:hypothetical protein FOZ62_020610, partial [Perkinsus olseni]
DIDVVAADGDDNASGTRSVSMCASDDYQGAAEIPGQQPSRFNGSSSCGPIANITAALVPPLKPYRLFTSRREGPWKQGSGQTGVPTSSSSSAAAAAASDTKVSNRATSEALFLECLDE